VGPGGQQTSQLAEEVKTVLHLGGSQVDNVQDAKQDIYLKKVISEGLEKVNMKATSRANVIKKWAILDEDFSVANGDLTPNWKIKRSYIEQKHKGLIENLYTEPKL
jgi:long-subunit acyl-CoA synthetase (AMP-forming)